MTYGNGRTLAVGYNSRLLPSSYATPGVMSKTYQYDSDARLDYAHDLIDSRYDRKNLYDQAGRIQTALSGAEARGEPATSDRPYNQTFGYDAWNNLKNRNSLQWTGGSSDAGSYVNNRRTDWSYDAAGDFISDNSYNALQHKYDAAGQLTQVVHPAFPNNPKRTDDYDGDGQRVRTSYQPEFFSQTVNTYYLRSTVLGGKIIDEIRSDGQKTMSYVYNPNGGLLAVQKLATTADVSAYVAWNQTDASGLSVRMTDAAGNVQTNLSGELDPVGADNALEDPYVNQPPYTPPDETSPAFPNFGNPTRPGVGCSFNGIPLLCADVMKRIADSAEPIATYSQELTPVGNLVSAGNVNIAWGEQQGEVLISHVYSHELTYWQQTGFASVARFAGYLSPSSLTTEPQEPGTVGITLDPRIDYSGILNKAIAGVKQRFVDRPECRQLFDKIDPIDVMRNHIYILSPIRAGRDSMRLQNQKRGKLCLWLMATLSFLESTSGSTRTCRSTRR